LKREDAIIGSATNLRFLKSVNRLRGSKDAPLDQPVGSLLRKASAFLAANSILAGTTGASILYVCFLLQGIFNYQLICACFFCTLSVYNTDKLTDLDLDLINTPERARFVKRHRKLVIASVVSTWAIAFFCGFLYNLYAVVIVAFGFCMGCLYSVGFLELRLKDVLIVKNATISGTFVVGTALMSLAVNSSDYVAIALVAYLVFLKLFINTVLFDVRDVEGDRRAGIVTIPTWLGKVKTKNVLLVLNSTFIPWATFAIFHGLVLKFVIILCSSIPYGYWYIHHFCSDAAVRKSMDLLLDGEWILLAVLLILCAFLTSRGLLNAYPHAFILLKNNARDFSSHAICLANK